MGSLSNEDGDGNENGKITFHLSLFKQRFLRRRSPPILGFFKMMIAASAGVADSGMVVVVAVVVKINNGELKQRRRRRQREREKSNRFRLVQQQLCPRIMLFCTFPCRRCTTTT